MLLNPQLCCKGNYHNDILQQVFFRAGVLGRLEDMRDERLGIVLTQFQSYCRGYLMRRQFKKLQDQRYGR